MYASDCAVRSCRSRAIRARSASAPSVRSRPNHRALSTASARLDAMRAKSSASLPLMRSGARCSTATRPDHPVRGAQADDHPAARELAVPELGLGRGALDADDAGTVERLAHLARGGRRCRGARERLRPRRAGCATTRSSRRRAGRRARRARTRRASVSRAERDDLGEVERVGERAHDVVQRVEQVVGERHAPDLVGGLALALLGLEPQLTRVPADDGRGDHHDGGEGARCGARPASRRRSTSAMKIVPTVNAKAKNPSR